MKMKIFGMTKSKGALEDGTKYDSAKIYSVARLKSADNHNGFAGIQLKGIPEIYQKWLDFPYVKEGTYFDVQTELMAGSKGSFEETVVSITALDVDDKSIPSVIPSKPRK